MKYTFFDIAIEEAYKSSFRIRMGAVVINQNKLVGKGHNICISSGRRYADGKHAEIAALCNTTAGDRKGSIVIVCRVNKEGDLRIAKPCDRCQISMKKMGVRRVIYSTNYGWEKMFL